MSSAAAPATSSKPNTTTAAADESGAVLDVRLDARIMFPQLADSSLRSKSPIPWRIQGLNAALALHAPRKSARTLP